MGSHQKIRINFQNRQSGSILPLEYELTGSDLSHKWFEALKTDVELNKPIFEGGAFLGPIFYRPDEIIDGMNQCIDYINTFKGKTWIPRKAFEGINYDKLMKIHDDFERLAPHPEFSLNEDRSFSESLLKLNDLIHKYEQFIYQDIDGFHIDLNFVHPGRYELDVDDYNEFSADWRWGRLFGAYGTTGVPTYNGAREEVDQTPLAQYYFSSGMYVNFEEIKFKSVKWYKWFDDRLINNYGKTLSHPYASFGLLYVGDYIPQYSKEELEEQIVHHAHVASVEVLNTKTQKTKITPYIDNRLTPEKVRKQPSCAGASDQVFLPSSSRLKLELVNESQEHLSVFFRLYNFSTSLMAEEDFYQCIGHMNLSLFQCERGYKDKKMFSYQELNFPSGKLENGRVLECFSMASLFGEISFSLDKSRSQVDQMTINFCPDKVPVPSESHRQRLLSWEITPVEEDQCFLNFPFAVLDENLGPRRKELIQFLDQPVKIRVLKKIDIPNEESVSNPPKEMLPQPHI